MSDFVFEQILQSWKKTDRPVPHWLGPKEIPRFDFV